MHISMTLKRRNLAPERVKRNLKNCSLNKLQIPIVGQGSSEQKIKML